MEGGMMLVPGWKKEWAAGIKGTGAESGHNHQRRRMPKGLERVEWTWGLEELERAWNC
jgi:hypothetical protein